MIQAIYGVLFVFVTLGIALAETPKGYVEVTATGSAETRDSALIDACRLAIGKVHGTRILGVMANRNSDGLKIDAAGHQGSKDTSFSVFGRTTDVADNTSMTFGGLLLRYEVLEEQKDTGPTGRWKIQIKGDVLNTIPDKFAGRLAVVLPSVNRIVSKMKSPDLSPEAIEGLARKLHDSVRDIFANHPQFVLLERENEDILNEELNRAQGSNAAVMEQSKLGGEKVADIVVEILPNPAKVELKTFTFENTPPLQKVKVHVSGLIKLLDLSTKGEIGSTKFDAANPKAVSSAGDVNNAISKAVNELNDTLDESMRSAKRNVLTSLGLANLLYTNTGEFAFAGGFDSSLISNGDRITIWKDEAGKKIKIREGEIALISTGFNFQDSPNANNEFKSGDAFSFTVVDSAKNKISEEKTTTNPNKPKLKDKLDFDL
jgi:hypothetical protein